jgi:outer membrane lipoprotein-sorting protein
MKDSDIQHADRALEDLLQGVPPLLPMPEADKRRVAEALRERATRPAAPAPRVERPSRWRLVALAVAAAMVLAVLAVLQPGSGGLSVAWADVVEQLTAARTVSGQVVRTVTAPDGRVTVTTGRMSFKDPGLVRIDQNEMVVTGPDGTTSRTTPPDAVLIVQALPEDTIILTVYPERRAAYRLEVDVTGTLLGPWRDEELNPAVVAWSKLRDLAADSTRTIGRRRIAGEEAVGFAAPLAEVMGPQELGLQLAGEVRVWASAETAVPLAVEIEKRPAEGWQVLEVVEPIEWNAALPDSMFDDSVTAGFEVHEGKAHKRGFPEPELKPHVTLRIGPETGGPVINERDVVGAVMGAVSFEPWRARKWHTMITFELTEEAAERLERYLRENPDTPLTVDFNGEIRGPWFFRQVVSHFIRVEITPLRKRLIEFEREYLLRGEEAVAAELERRRAMTETAADGD